MQIPVPLIADSNSMRNPASFLLFRMTHQTDRLGILRSQTLLTKL